MCKKNYIWNPALCGCKNGIYVGCIIDESVITCFKTIDTTKTVQMKKRKWKKVTYKTKNFYILLIFLLMAVSIYFYMVLPYHVLNNKLEKSFILIKVL